MSSDNLSLTKHSVPTCISFSRYILSFTSVMSTDGTCTAICCGLYCKWYPNRLLVRILNNNRYRVILSTSTMVQYECVSPN